MTRFLRGARVAYRPTHSRPALRRVLPVLASMLLGVPLAQAGPATERFERAIEPAVAEHRFMGAVLVAKDGATLFDRGYGSADLEWQVPASPATKFRLGSLTKQFTAAAILLLQERGKLKLDDPLSRYLPDVPAAWRDITLFQLLTHTSGLPNFTEFPDYAVLRAQPATPAQLLARLRDKPLDFAPGADWRYSNSGYIVLGCVIEKVSGQTYADFLRQAVFEPLGMHDSGYDSNDAILANRAQGYAAGAQRHAGYIDMSIPFAAGGLYSTTHDLLRWEEGLFGGKLLSAASLEKMTQPFKHDYALGVAVHTLQGHRVVEHNGAVDGFRTHLAYFPNEHIVVVVLANVESDAADAIGRNLGLLAVGADVVLPAERKPVTLPRATLLGYAGVYQLTPQFKIAFFLDGDQFMTQATGQAALPIFAASEREFYLEAVDAQVTFEKDAAGAVTGMVLHQGGQDHRGKRIDATH